MRAVDDTTAKTVEAKTRFKISSRRRPMDTSEYAQAHGTLYRLGPKTSKRARKQQKQQAA
jgi:hypothetical protein